jgi:hypothetical protein
MLKFLLPYAFLLAIQSGLAQNGAVYWYDACVIGRTYLYGPFYVRVDLCDSTLTEGIRRRGAYFPVHQEKIFGQMEPHHLYMLRPDTYAILRRDEAVVYRQGGFRVYYTNYRR